MWKIDNLAHFYLYQHILSLNILNSGVLECWLSNGVIELSNVWSADATESRKIRIQWKLRLFTQTRFHATFRQIIRSFRRNTCRWCHCCSMLRSGSFFHRHLITHSWNVSWIIGCCLGRAEGSDTIHKVDGWLPDFLSGLQHWVSHTEVVAELMQN